MKIRNQKDFMLRDLYAASVLLLFVIFSSRPCVAKDLSVPTHQFLKDLFENPKARGDFREMWTGTPNASGARDDPDGGYLFRFTLQFEGSDEILAFLGTDRFGDLPRSTPDWSVFQGTPEGSWKLLSGGEAIQTGGFLVHHSSRTVIREFPDRFGEGKSYKTLKFVKSGLLEKNSYRSEETPSEVRGMIEGDAVFEDFEVEKIPLVSYMRSPLTKWRPLSEHGMEAQSLDPGDAPYLSSIGKIPWAAAVKIYGAFDELATKEELRDQPLEMASEGASFSEEAARGIPQEKTQGKSGTEPSWVRWIVLVVVIVLGGSLGWCWVKRRS